MSKIRHSTADKMEAVKVTFRCIYKDSLLNLKCRVNTFTCTLKNAGLFELKVGSDMDKSLVFTFFNLELNHPYVGASDFITE